MMKTMKATIAGISTAAMLATGSVVAVPAVNAAPASGAYGDAQVILAGDRGSNRWDNKNRWNNDRRHYKRHRNNDFPVLLFGLAAGAMLGSALSQPQYSGNNWDAYCSSKYRSYKPWTGTYTGYDGYQHRCR